MVKNLQVHRCRYDGFSSGTSLEHWRFSTCGATEEVIRSIGSRKLGHGIVEERHVEKCIGRGVGFFQHGNMDAEGWRSVLWSMLCFLLGMICWMNAVDWMRDDFFGGGNDVLDLARKSTQSLTNTLDLPFSPRMLARDKWRFVTNAQKSLKMFHVILVVTLTGAPWIDPRWSKVYPFKEPHIHFHPLPMNAIDKTHHEGQMRNSGVSFFDWVSLEDLESWSVFFIHPSRNLVKVFFMTTQADLTPKKGVPSLN